MDKDYYNQSFFDQHVGGSLRSADVFLRFLFAIWTPVTLVDLGCGRGAWLSVAKRLGVEQLSGIDGDWISQHHLICEGMKFMCTISTSRLICQRGLILQCR